MDSTRERFSTESRIEVIRPGLAEEPAAPQSSSGWSNGGESSFSWRLYFIRISADGQASRVRL